MARVRALGVVRVRTLRELVTEAQVIAGDHPCKTFGHAWETDGGRVCQVHGDGCSEPVYRCGRCGEWDYEHHEGECSREH